MGNFTPGTRIGDYVVEREAGDGYEAILVLELIRDLADILAHAHERGIVHRALRAETVVRDFDGVRGFPVCIVDWSDARVDGGDRCRADDIFALGVIAHQALTGHLPTG